MMVARADYFGAVARLMNKWLDDGNITRTDMALYIDRLFQCRLEILFVDYLIERNKRTGKGGKRNAATFCNNPVLYNGVMECP